MKNKYKIVLFIFAVFIGYILYTNKKIDGVWVTVYNIPPNGGIFPESAKIFEIKNGTIKIHSLYEEIFEDNFIVFNNRFFLQKDLKNAELSILNKDSMVIKFPSQNKLVLKRIPEKYKSNSKNNIMNKTFWFKNNNIVDTIYFTKNNLLFKKIDKKNDWEAIKLKRIQINDFDIIHTQFAVFISKKKNNKQFLYKPSNEYKFIEIELNKTNSNLYYIEKTLKLLEKEE